MMRNDSALSQRLRQGPVLWVHERTGERWSWLSDRLSLPWLMVKPCHTGWEEEWSSLRKPSAILWEVTTEFYVSDLQSLVRLRRHSVPTMVIASLSDPLKELRSHVRSVGPADVLVGWAGLDRLSLRLARWFSQHPIECLDPYDIVARRLPGEFRS